MVIDLKFSRFESAPWGFRLVGGSDYDIPLTVIKVTEESLAEKAGLRVGDVIVRINDESTTSMTHNDAHDAIKRSGNNFFFGVMRALDENENSNENQIEDQIQHQDQEQFIELNVNEEIPQRGHTPTSTEPIQRQNAVDEEIAEIMSGEAEVLQEHNVIGIFPKPGICMSSEVLQTLNEESIKTEKELEQEKRKWTTFLQRPNRPVPKSKKELEEEAKRIPYKVQIVRQPKPRVAPDRPPSPPPPPVVEIDEEIKIEEQQPEPEPLGPEPTDTEIPNLEQITIKSEIESEIIQEIQESTIEVSEIVTEQHVEELTIASSSSVETKTEVVTKSEEELAIEKQLSDVQKQLLALSTLPSTIQATLDSVTKQLSELLPAFRLESSPMPENKEQIKIDPEVKRRDKEMEDMMKICQERITKLSENKILEIPRLSSPINIEQQIEQKQQIMQKEEQEQQLQDELTYKKQKEKNLITELEHKQRSIREGTPRKSRKLFGPLTPQERPLILPGGRKWRKPKDAYNDEFIAEVLSSQAELITGTTLGRTFESSHLGYDERHYNFIALTELSKQRVNFLKYQKPEKKIDLQKSEVYKVIHNLEREPIRGIEVRPPKVLAEEDVRRCTTPISCT